jgi:hypothetical protein
VLRTTERGLSIEKTVGKTRFLPSPVAGPKTSPAVCKKINMNCKKDNSIALIKNLNAKAIRLI